ncbi:MAG: hypothetical protein JW873_04130 [Candidatus Saganbacteria bacterium]|nr:hypothetical protein [Candidatus Saganbacteria bacterium]
MNIIFCKHPEFVENPRQSKFFLDLHAQLSHSSYPLEVKDDKNVITHSPKWGDGIKAIRREANCFANQLGLGLLTDQTVDIISLQNGISDPYDLAQLRSCEKIVIYVQEQNPLGPIAKVRQIAAGSNSHWLESAGFNSRLLKGTDCTVFDCVVRALAPFGVVREDLPRLVWRTPAAGIRNIRRKFFLHNPDLTAEINEAECPARLRKMPPSQLKDLRSRIAERMTRANFIAWKIDGYRNVKGFRGLSLQEVGELCFPFMADHVFKE